MDEVRRLGALKDSQINEAKKVLAYEVTKLVHRRRGSTEGAGSRRFPVRRRGTERLDSDDRNHGG